MTLLDVLLWFLVACLVIALYFLQQWSRSPFAGLPGIHSLSRLVYEVLGKYGTVYDLLLSCHERFGPVFVFAKVRGGALLVVVDLDFAKKHYSQAHFIKSVRRKPSKFFERFVGMYNVAHSNGETWARQRKAANPAFQWQSLKKFQEKFVREAHRGLRYLECGKPDPAVEEVLKKTGFDAGRGRVVAMTRFSDQMVVDTLGACIYSLDMKQFEEEEARLALLGRRIMAELESPARAFLGQWVELLPLQSNRDIDADITELNELLRGVMNEHLSQAGEKNAEKLDLVDHLVGSLSETEVMRNLLLLFFAGQENTSNTFVFTIQYLAEHQDVQDKVRAEARALLGDSLSPTVEQLKDLKYLRMVLKEVLRLHPPVLFTQTRVAVKPFTVGGRTFPAGTPAAIPVLLYHMNPEWWDNPTEFRPERFEGKVTPLSWLPFGTGPRQCLGMNFLMMELRVFVATLALRYRFEPGPQQPSWQKKTYGRSMDFTTGPILGPRNVYINFIPLY